MTATKSNKDSYLLLTLQYGDSSDPEFSRYTDWTKGVSHSGATYTATPKLACKLPENSGKLDERPLEIDLPLEGFVDVLSNGYPHSPVFVTLEESRIDDTGSQETDVHFRGKLKTSTRNPEGSSGIVRLECVSWKSLLDASLSFVADTQCVNMFGNEITCKVVTAPYARQGVVSSILGNTVVITGMVPVTNPLQWLRGYVEYRGLRLQIREYETGDTFHLVKEPPGSWAGQNVKVAAGCNLYIETCRFYNNEGNFNGIGYATPRYNPVIESPT